MSRRWCRVVLALLSVAPQEAAQAHRSARTSDISADPSHSLSFRQARPRPLAPHHRLRGGASSVKPSVKQTGNEPALKPKFAAYVVAWAVLPTLLRLAFAAATMPPPPLAETEGWLQLAGLVATDAATRSSAPALPFPKRWQLALAAAWVANNLAVVVPGRCGPPHSWLELGRYE